MNIQPLTEPVMTSRTPVLEPLRVAVKEGSGLSRRRLLVALAEAWGFEIAWTNQQDISADCLVLEALAEESSLQYLCHEIPTLIIPSAGDLPGEKCETQFTFTSSPSLAAPFHGVQASAKELHCLPTTHIKAGESVVAYCGDKPLWLRSGHRHRLNFVPRDLKGDENLCDLCKGGDFIHALPFLFLLREARLRAGWCAPPLRACFMFDDPNLHWPTYGFVDYAAMAECASVHNYHVSLATVPLDAWYVNQRAAALFKHAPAHLSLLIHGNDHTIQELAQPMPPGDRQSLLRAALERIERLERKAGFSVSRVMAAPHGACREEMLHDMAELGFEAACISPWSLRDHNPDRPWVQHLGVTMAEMIGGLPVIPRFRLHRDCLPQALIAALLDQPIVAVGHHQDLARGMGLLNRLAESINTRLNVKWMDMHSIAASNFWTRQQVTTMHVLPFTRDLHVEIPSGVIALEVAGNGFPPDSTLECSIMPSGQPSRTTSIMIGEHLPVQEGDRIRIRVRAASAEDPLNRDVGATNGVRPWPLVRRLLSEVRDRALPLMMWRRRGC